jgi:phenylpropionate dioxygenase-like ring-hydroxylating dioxygenase large terminal subunit
MPGAVRAGGRVISSSALRAVNRRQNRASTLPAPLFSDLGIYEAEQDRLFRKSWQCIGREDEFVGPGAFRTFEIAGSGVVVLRNQRGELKAYHNVCRHRGTRILEAPEGTGLKRLLCPYHAWSYDLDGRLLGAPHMGEAEGFDRSEFGLFPVALRTWRGFVFLSLAPKPEPLETTLGGLVERTRGYPLERLRRTHRVTYEIAANWKLVVQNANECYHCPGVHPQLVKITPYRSGEEDLRKGPVFGGWMDFVEEANTGTLTGRTARPPFPNLSPEDLRRVYYYVLYPSNFLSLFPDYVTFDWFIPVGPEKTRLVFDVYVDRDESDPASDAMEFWEMTNRQDWHICEMAHLGSKTAAFFQGRYSAEEEVVHLVDRFYLKKMGFLGRAR